jgi:hypothetical protein
MVAFTKDVASSSQGGFYARSTDELNHCIKVLRAIVVSSRKDKLRAENNDRFKISFRLGFIKHYCADNGMNRSECKAISESDQHFYHFLTFPLINTQSYRYVVTGFVTASSAVPSRKPDLLDQALKYLSQSLKEAASAADVPDGDGVDGVAVRLIATEMLYYEMVKNNPQAILVEALLLVLESFLRVKDKFEVKVT